MLCLHAGSPGQLSSSLHHTLSTVEEETALYAKQAAADWERILLHRCVIHSVCTVHCALLCSVGVGMNSVHRRHRGDECVFGSSEARSLQREGVWSLSTSLLTRMGGILVCNRAHPAGGVLPHLVLDRNDRQACEDAQPIPEYLAQFCGGWHDH